MPAAAWSAGQIRRRKADPGPATRKKSWTSPRRIPLWRQGRWLVSPSTLIFASWSSVPWPRLPARELHVAQPGSARARPHPPRHSPSVRSSRSSRYWLRPHPGACRSCSSPCSPSPATAIGPTGCAARAPAERLLRRLYTARLTHETARVRAAGIKVSTLTPGPEDLTAMGSNRRTSVHCRLRATPSHSPRVGIERVERVVTGVLPGPRVQPGGPRRSPGRMGRSIRKRRMPHGAAAVRPVNKSVPIDAAWAEVGRYGYHHAPDPGVLPTKSSVWG
jgi:hypothetical protein